MSTRGKRANRFQRTLDRYKQNEKPESILLVAQDWHLLRLLAVWDETRVQRRRRLSPFPENGDDEMCWQWLWKNACCSVEELAGLTGLSTDAVEKKTGVLIGNRIVYPDGTMTRLAAQFLRTRVLALFNHGNPARSGRKTVARKNV
ncbi:MAG TPA: hypothetical protein PLO37_21415 [Candidatus Hydrogenedentes bacterium]|nr:hypothetical protein [Candidatus Hydrogenedentota bacterium]HPG69412.1 hypothetical protein [Candidatus Hydrogenedentota bacterium]